MTNEEQETEQENVKQLAWYEKQLTDPLTVSATTWQ